MTESYFGIKLSRLILHKYILINSVFLLFIFQDFLKIGFYTYFSCVLIVLSMFLLMICFKMTYDTLFKIITLTFILLFFKYLSETITQNGTTYNNYISLLTAVLLSYLILKKDSEGLIIKSFYYIVFIYLIVIFSFLIFGVDPENIWPSSSRNTVSQIFVIFGAFFIINKKFLLQLKFVNVFYFLILMSSILAIGRSGIVSSLILFLAFVMSRYELRNKRFSNIYLIIYFSFFILFLFFWQNIFKFVSGYEKFEYIINSGLGDSYRLNMITEFIKKYNFVIFMFGVDFFTLPYTASFNGNPHNGFIYLHGKFGIIAIFLFFGLALSVFRFIIRRKYIELTAILSLLFRFSTDEALGLIIFPIVYLSVMGVFSIPKIKLSSKISYVS